MKYIVEGQDVESATAALMEMLKPMYGEAIKNVRLEHVDAAGYWFSYELEHDSRRQTWCVRHSDLEG